MKAKRKAVTASGKTQATATKTSKDSISPSKRKVKPPHALSIYSTVKTFAFKIYEEQADGGFSAVADRIRTYPKADDGSGQKPLQLEAAVHDSDVVTDDFWTLATEKPHMHIIGKCLTRHDCIRLKTVMTALGIVFRPGMDDDLWAHHGAETVGDFSRYSMYLTHETPDAERDGKYIYPVDRIITNLSPEELKRVREGYTRLSPSESRPDYETLVKLDADAYQLGKEGGDFSAWYHSQSLAIRSAARMKTIRESYNYGLDEYLATAETSTVDRLCVFIQGRQNDGKTFASMHALCDAFGYDGAILKIAGQGTGKYDRLTSATRAIVVDDDTLPNILGMADNYKCRVYRRGSDNRPWCGDVLIVTSNLTFGDWLTASGINYATPRGAAAESRFFVCRAEEGKLDLLSYSDRGTPEEQTARMDRFERFRSAYEAVAVPYAAEKAKSPDLSSHLGILPTEEKSAADAADPNQRISAPSDSSKSDEDDFVGFDFGDDEPVDEDGTPPDAACG